MGLKEIGWEGVDWICLVQERDWWLAVMNIVKNLKSQKRWGVF
jgi:hypothetical protein